MSFAGKILKLASLSGYPEGIGRDLWRLEDARARTLRAVQGLPQAHLDTEPEGGGNAVGTLLYHLAAIEADWLYVEVLQEGFPEDILALFPVDVRDERKRLSPMLGVNPETHLDRLSFMRGRLLERFAELSEADYHRLRKLPDYEVTPEWVLHHLAQHEALHRGQILQLLRHASIS